MKITDLKSYVIQMDWDDRPGGKEPRNIIPREFVFVQIDTDEGITGWGEITNYRDLITRIAVLFCNLSHATHPKEANALASLADSKS